MMIPSQRELVKRMADKPFTLLGINSDHMSRSALEKKLEEEEVTWPQLIEGSEQGVSLTWNVRVYPTLYVIDHQGIIRARNLHDEAQVENTLKELIAKVPKGG